ncbi:MAG: hypothetical protein QOJ79_3475 [Actinomycetota bacterium]|jgi:hypothetical protein|nr:hypothetical protein [Actinomycetota bacterium]
MCTVVVRWGGSVEILALRDELVGREFDDPGPWWPAQPSVVGGRDRVAGGSWCVTDTASGVTALVLNRPQKRVGTPSRGALPLLGVAHGVDWPSYIDMSGMASFALVLAAPDALTQWVWDGERLMSSSLGSGIHMVTSGGEEDGKADRYLADFAAAPAGEWPALVARHDPEDDRAALVVRHPFEGGVYATVFGQVITAGEAGVQLKYSRTPWDLSSWRP